MDSIEQIQKIMRDLKARSGKAYAVQLKQGKAQLVILTKEARKTIVTPVCDWMLSSEVYALADRLERKWE